MARAYRAWKFGSNAEEKGYPHREHRSKKGRRGTIHKFGKLMVYKQKKQTLKEKELDEN